MSQKNPYEDILHCTYVASPEHPRMSARDRAAQFSPFAALTGYDEEIGEAARLTDVRREKGDEEWDALNKKIRLLADYAPEHPAVSILFFVPDSKKEGGSYQTLSGNLKWIDESERILVLTTGEKIPLDDLEAIDSPLLERKKPSEG